MLANVNTTTEITIMRCPMYGCGKVLFFINGGYVHPKGDCRSLHRWTLEELIAEHRAARESRNLEAYANATDE
jgi:hypothetical protein